MSALRSLVKLASWPRVAFPLAAITLALNLVATTAAAFPATAKPFSVFNSVAYDGTPDLSAYGIRSIKTIYEADLDDPPASHSNDRQFSMEKVDNAAQSAGKNPGELVVLDMETWGWNPAAMQKYAKALQEFKRLNPQSKVSMFNKPAPSAVWRIYQSDAKPLVDHIDFLTPMLYTHGADAAAWAKEAKLIVQLLRQEAPGKPIYAYVWPQYNAPHAGCKQGSLGAQFLPASVWRSELETLYPIVDGVILWSPRWACSGSDEETKYPKFDAKMPWFVQTEAFMKAHNIH
ncbi:hypothetical protein [Rhodanobacter sp. DHG33]|uniref:hypothetical protein n=1 Tax=Rhodanobacter sp. DHG33 TaxID=2775921 RepID=UPI00178710D2|nr:hypothetical protein [Rhodanobacter sp. DHG33]MBD8897430.1 hypothetical protein [Rhodanobacter sp. DHG33]